MAVHKPKHQYSRSREAPQQPCTLNHFLTGLIMSGRRVNNRHIKNLFLMCTKRNWNRTEKEQWLRPRGFPYRFSSEIRLMSMTHLLHHLYNGKTTQSGKRKSLPDCFHTALCCEAFSDRSSCNETGIPSAICRKRASHGEQDHGLFLCFLVLSAMRRKKKNKKNNLTRN